MDGFLQKATQFAEQQFQNSESGSANRIAHVQQGSSTGSHRLLAGIEPNHQTGNPPSDRYIDASTHRRIDASSHRPTETRFAATPARPIVLTTWKISSC
jgi:hypothetical protein